MIDIHLEENVHRMIAAPTGGGKSYFVGYLVEQLHDMHIPFIVMDTKTENHIGLQALPNVKVLDITPRRKYRNLAELTKYPYILCVPASRDIELKEIIDIYRQIMGYIWLHEKGKRVFVCEEAHNWNKNASVCDPLFEKLAREGRGAEKLVWFVTQRLQNFSQLLWSQCKYSYIYHHYSPTDIRYISQMIPEFDWRRGAGEKTPGINAELQDHDVLVWDGRGYEIIKANEIQRRTRHFG